jgi:hypothetical protein
MDSIRLELQLQIQTQMAVLTENLRRELRSLTAQRPEAPRDLSPLPPLQLDLPEEPDLPWTDLLTDLPTVLEGPPPEPAKIFKMARELKRRAALMTAGRDLHDIHTVVYMAAHWEVLQPSARTYLTHRMRLLYIAVTKGWPAALFYDQQGTDEFLDVPADFWAHYQPPPRPKAAQLRSGPSRGRSSTRRGRGRPS